MAFHGGRIGFIPILIISNVLRVNGNCYMQVKITRCQYYDNKEPTNGIGFTVNATSNISCFHNCLNSGLTRSVFYNPATKVCQCADKPPLSLGLQHLSGVVCWEENGYKETWASFVINKSTEYDYIGGDLRYLATQILGASDVYPTYGDKAGTWCPNVTDDNQWIEIGIPEPMFLDHLYVYETYHAGGVETISVRDTQDTWHNLWTTPGIQVIRHSRIFEPNFQSTSFKINGLRLDLVMSVADDWVQFDAVRFVGRHPATKVCQCADKPPLSLGLQHLSGVVEENGYKETWASFVINKSTEYDYIGGDLRYLATQILGASDVYPTYGDKAGTWCPNVTDDNQWIEIGIPEPMFLDHLYVYETYHAGGVETISVRDTQDTWHNLWTTPGIQVIRHSRIFEPNFQSTSFKINGLRLDLVMSVADDWVQFDAVRFVGRHRYLATQILGASDVYPTYGDKAGTWCPNVTDDNQWIEIGIPEPMFLDHLYVYETYHAGGVETISVRDTQDTWHNLWTTPGIQVIRHSRIFEPNFQSTSFKINGLRLDLVMSVADDWVQFDAVRFVGRHPATKVCQCADKPPLSLGLQHLSGVVEENGYKETWASFVINKSTKYDYIGGDLRYLATQILGASDVYPTYGDKAGTWCPNVTDDNQWIEIGIPEPMFLDHLYVYETYHAGGVETISVRDTQDTWHNLWTTPGIQVIRHSRIFEPNFQSTSFKINGLRLDLVMSVADDWVQFDAVRFVGRQ